MHKLLIKHWFFIGMVLVIAIAFNFPGVGTKLKQWKIINIGIFMAFFLSGITLETSSIVDEVKNIKGILAALISIFALFPIVAFFLSTLLIKGMNDFIVGVCIIAVAPTTIASGTVLTGIALGNIPLSLFICVASNFLAVLTIPFSLELLLKFGQTIDIPVFQVIKSLIIIVLIPLVIGQSLRGKLKNIASHERIFSIFSQMIVLLIILNSVASSTSEISKTGFGLISIFWFVILLHCLILLLNLGISKLIRLNKPSTAAFTIHSSQKTLTVSYIVWAGYFALSYPFAMIPAIVYHLIQMVVDTFVAHKFRAITEKTV